MLYLDEKQEEEITDLPLNTKVRKIPLVGGQKLHYYLIYL